MFDLDSQIISTMVNSSTIKNTDLSLGTVPRPTCGHTCTATGIPRPLTVMVDKK